MRDIGSIPILQTQNSEPYSASWVAIFLFGTYSAVMMLALVLITVDSSGMSLRITKIARIIQLYIILFLLFSSFSLLFQIPSLSNQNVFYKNRTAQLLPGLMLFVYSILYFIIVLIVDDSASFVNILNNPFGIIAGIEAAILSALFFLLTRPLVPSIPAHVEDRVGFLDRYFSMWWKVMQLVLTIVLSVAIGIAIAIFISDLSILAPLSIHMSLSSVPSISIIVYIFLKTRVILKMMSEEL